jgi:hypothetical protein
MFYIVNLGDSATMPNGRCTPCISFNGACTHTHQVMKRGPKNRFVASIVCSLSAIDETSRRIEELQKQLAVLEAKLTSVDSFHIVNLTAIDCG